MIVPPRGGIESAAGRRGVVRNARAREGDRVIVLHLMKLALRRLIDAVATVAVGIAVAYACGALFIWLWAPTPETSSPPPEFFLFLFGRSSALPPLSSHVFVLVPLWSRRRHRAGGHS